MENSTARPIRPPRLRRVRPDPPRRHRMNPPETRRSPSRRLNQAAVPKRADPSPRHPRTHCRPRPILLRPPNHRRCSAHRPRPICHPRPSLRHRNRFHPSRLPHPHPSLRHRSRFRRSRRLRRKRPPTLQPPRLPQQLHHRRRPSFRHLPSPTGARSPARSSSSGRAVARPPVLAPWCWTGNTYSRTLTLCCRRPAEPVRV